MGLEVVTVESDGAAGTLLWQALNSDVALMASSALVVLPRSETQAGSSRHQASSVQNSLQKT